MACTKGCKAARWSESHQSMSKFGSQSATRLREGGVASNRGSACRGEYVPGPCTHRPSHHGSWVDPKTVRQPERGAAGHGRFSDWREVGGSSPPRPTSRFADGGPRFCLAPPRKRGLGPTNRFAPGGPRLLSIAL